MDKRRKYRRQMEELESQLPRFFIRPFLKYLAPHKMRLTIAFIAMIIVGFTGSFSIILLITPLKILLEQGRPQTAHVTLKETMERGHRALSDARAARTAPGQTLDDPVFKALVDIDAAWKDKDAKSDDEGSSKIAPDKLLKNPGGFLGKFDNDVRKMVEPFLAPYKARFYAWNERFNAWIVLHPISALWTFAGILVGVTLFNCVLEYLTNYLLSYSLYSAVIRLKEDIFRHIIHLDYGFFIQRTTGYLENRINSDVNRVKSIFDILMSDAVQQPITLFFLFALLVIISPQLTLIALVGVILGFWPLLYFAKQIRNVTRKSKSKEDELSSVMEESLRNFRVVKIFGTEDVEVRKFHRLNQRLFELSMNRRLARFGASPVMEILGSLGVSAVLIVGGILVRQVPGGPKPILEPVYFIAYLFVLTRFYGPLKKLSRININWQVARVSAARIFEMLNLTSSVSEVPDALPIKALKKGVSFKNVSFTYGRNPVLVDISFELDRGKVVALVGRSGSGKTTLANLLPRLLDPKDGSIEVDGVDARQLKIADLRHLFGVVTQDTILFNDTVAANIAYGSGAVEEDRLVEAAKAAHAHDFILALEGRKGYKTVIGQSGQQLSGGQRQRLAIARALYRDPEILIFDEATSSLDTQSERYVQQAIDNLLSGRTALIIAHRLSTVQHADEILVLRDGRIVERGNHEQLLANGGEYWSLYHLSAELDGGGPREIPTDEAPALADPASPQTV